MKVLLAEDDKATRKLIARVLEKNNFTVICVSDGQRALDILEDNHDINLLVTDMNMPTLAGRELIERIRAHEYFSDLPVLIVSGIITLSSINDLMKTGASRFLPKPLDMKQLVEYSLHLTAS